MFLAVSGIGEPFEIDACRSFANYQKAPCFTPYTPGISGSTIIAYWDCADPGRATVARFRIDFSPTDTDDPDFAEKILRNAGRSITISMTLKQDGKVVANAELPFVRSATLLEC
jgi:hypothetical protein